MPVHLSTPVSGGCVRGHVPAKHASSRCSLPLFLGVPELVGVQQGDGNICPGEDAGGGASGCGVPVVVVCGCAGVWPW